MSQIQTIVTEFTQKIIDAVTEATNTRVRLFAQKLLGAATHISAELDVPREAKNPAAQAAPFVRPSATRKSNGQPKQLCPVPKCRRPAAPVFGMVCGDHKNVAKSTIKKYREARRAA